MNKHSIALFAALLITTLAKSQSADTITTYIKFRGGSPIITTPDSAQLMRVILPADDGDDRVNVREYDMEGHMLFAGKYDGIYKRKGYPYKTGSCIAFYPNGKRKSITNYVLDQKEGDEYFFYPTGRVFYYNKNIYVNGYQDRTEHLECYDTEGNQVCKAGNGVWLVYNKSYDNLMFTGPVKNGKFNGIWNGKSEMRDSVKYNCLFEDGVFKEGKGFDKNGRGYKFTQDIIPASYPDGMITFLRVLRSHLTLPKDKDGNKISLKGALISFVVEKDGALTDIEIVSNDNSEAIANLNTAMAKLKHWVPRQHYGVPFRAKITIPIKEDSGFLDKYDSRNSLYQRKVEYREQVLDL